MSECSSGNSFCCRVSSMREQQRLLQTEVQFLHPAPRDEGASIAPATSIAHLNCPMAIAGGSLQAGRVSDFFAASRPHRRATSLPHAMW
jgi:hypothetical protein